MLSAALAAVISIGANPSSMARRVIYLVQPTRFWEDGRLKTDTGGIVRVRVGDVLLYNVTYGGTGSNGYQWLGPAFSRPGVLGHVSTFFTPWPDSEALRQVKAERARRGPPAPGEWVDRGGASYRRFEALKLGRTLVTFYFARSREEAKRAGKQAEFDVLVEPSRS